MAAVWQVQEAKNRLSELLDKAASEGPQVITRHGRPVAKVVSLDAPAGGQAGDDDGFVAYLLNAPKSGLPEGLPPMPRSTTDDREPLFGASE